MIKKCVTLILFVQCVSYAAQAPDKENAEYYSAGLDTKRFCLKDIENNTQKLYDYIMTHAKQDDQETRKSNIRDFLRIGACLTFSAILRPDIQGYTTILTEIINEDDAPLLILLIEILCEPEFQKIDISLFHFADVYGHLLIYKKNPFVLKLAESCAYKPSITVEDYSKLLAFYINRNGNIDAVDVYRRTALVIVSESGCLFNLLEALIYMGADETIQVDGRNIKQFLVYLLNKALTERCNQRVIDCAHKSNVFEKAISYRNGIKESVQSVLTQSFNFPATLIQIIFAYTGWQTAADKKIAK